MKLPNMTVAPNIHAGNFNDNYRRLKKEVEEEEEDT